MTTHSTAAKQPGKHAPPARSVDPDIADARAQAKLVHIHLAEARRQRVALLASKHTADPDQIRLAAADLERTKVLLEVAIIIIGHGAFLPGGDAAELVDAREAASLVAKELEREIVRARAQADRRADSMQGRVRTSVDVASVDMGPEETRLRGDRSAPPGLCDDKELQVPTSPVCPLEADARGRNRIAVRDRLTAAANHWRDAIAQSKLDEEIAQLTKKHGLPPLAEMLLDVFTGFVGGKATSALSSYADRKAMNLLKDNTKGLVALGQKVADKTLKAADKAPATQDLHSRLEVVVNAWELEVKEGVPHLTDPELVVAAERLKASALDRAYFDGKLRDLLAAYRPVAALGTPDINGLPYRLAWVTAPGQPARLATYRKQVCNAVDGLTECAIELLHARRLGAARLTFEQWIDPSMYGMATSREPDALTIDIGDPRWATAPSPSTAISKTDGIQVVGLRPAEDLK